jgi:hypothetical protein
MNRERPGAPLENHVEGLLARCVGQTSFHWLTYGLYGAYTLRTRLYLAMARCADLDRSSIGEMVYATRKPRMPKNWHLASASGACDRSTTDQRWVDAVARGDRTLREGISWDGDFSFFSR